jgi:hypothetical protein
MSMVTLCALKQCLSFRVAITTAYAIFSSSEYSNLEPDKATETK